MSKRFGLTLFLFTLGIGSIVGCGGSGGNTIVPPSSNTAPTGTTGAPSAGTAPPGGMMAPPGASSGAPSGDAASGGETASGEKTEGEAPAANPEGGAQPSAEDGASGNPPPGQSMGAMYGFGPQGNNSGGAGPSPADYAARMGGGSGRRPAMSSAGGGGGSSSGGESQPAPGGQAPPGAGAGSAGASITLDEGEGGPGANFSGGQPGGFPGAPSSVPADNKPAEDAPLIEKAKYAFSVGREADAYKLLAGHILVSDSDSAELLGKAGWVKGLFQPALGVRFAVGVELKAPPSITDYKPIGSGGQGPGGGDGMSMAAASGGPGGMGGGGGGNSKDDPALFEKTTGDFGRSFVSAFETRWGEGKFGSYFVDVEDISNGPTGGGNEPGMMSSSGGAGMAQMMRRSSGGGMPPGMGGPAPAARKAPGTGHRLTRGLTYIGSGSMNDLKGKALKDGYDVLVLFEVVVQRTRTGITKNDTKCQIVNLKATKNPIIATKRLNNLEVQKAMESGESGEVDSAVAALFKGIEENLAFSDLPTIKAESVKKRVSDLANGKEKETNQLRVLTEIALYHSKQWINDDEKKAAFELVLGGSEGANLASGPEAQKLDALKKYLPKL